MSDLTTLNKIEVAKDFVALHKENNVSEWQPLFDDSDKQWLAIFSSLENEVYGSVRDNGYYDDDDCEVYVEPTEWEIEVSSFESKSGNPIVFNWSI